MLTQEVTARPRPLPMPQFEREYLGDFVEFLQGHPAAEHVDRIDIDETTDAGEVRITFWVVDERSERVVRDRMTEIHRMLHDVQPAGIFFETDVRIPRAGYWPG
jgi:hypothetical protein